MLLCKQFISTYYQRLKSEKLKSFFRLKLHVFTHVLQHFDIVDVVRESQRQSRQESIVSRVQQRCFQDDGLCRAQSNKVLLTDNEEQCSQTNMKHLTCFTHILTRLNYLFALFFPLHPNQHINWYLKWVWFCFDSFLFQYLFIFHAWNNSIKSNNEL